MCMEHCISCKDFNWKWCMYFFIYVKIGLIFWVALAFLASKMLGDFSKVLLDIPKFDSKKKQNYNQCFIQTSYE